MLFTTLSDGCVCVVADDFSEGHIDRDVKSLTIYNFNKGLTPWKKFLKDANVDLNNLHYIKSLNDLKKDFPELYV